MFSDRVWCSLFTNLQNKEQQVYKGFYKIENRFVDTNLFFFPGLCLKKTTHVKRFPDETTWPETVLFQIV